MKLEFQRDIHMFITPLFSKFKLWNQPRYPSLDEQMEKMWQIYDGILFSHQKSKTLSLATKWLELEDIMLSEISQDKDFIITYQAAKVDLKGWELVTKASKGRRDKGRANIVQGCKEE